MTALQQSLSRVSPIELSLVVLILTLAGFLQGVSGFGFGLTVMGLLPLVISVQQTQAAVTVLNVAVCILNVAVTFRHFHWRGVTSLMLGTWVGVPLGFWFLASLPSDAVKRWLGAALLAMVLFDFYLVRHRGLRYPHGTAFWIGLAGGNLGGAFNIGGPPLVAWIYARDWSKERIVATLSVIFLTTGLIRLSLLAGTSQIDSQVRTIFGWALVPMLLGLLAGHRLLTRVSQRLLRNSVYIVLGVLGLGYVAGLI